MSEKAEIRSQVAHLDGVELRRELRKVKCPVMVAVTRNCEDCLKHKALDWMSRSHCRRGRPTRPIRPWMRRAPPARPRMLGLQIV